MRIIFEKEDEKGVAIMEFMEFLGAYYPPGKKDCFFAFMMKMYNAIKDGKVEPLQSSIGV
jgi:hypothetical protein